MKAKLKNKIEQGLQGLFALTTRALKSRPGNNQNIGTLLDKDPAYQRKNNDGTKWARQDFYGDLQICCPHCDHESLHHLDAGWFEYESAKRDDNGVTIGVEKKRALDISTRPMNTESIQKRIDRMGFAGGGQRQANQGLAEDAKQDRIDAKRDAGSLGGVEITPDLLKAAAALLRAQNGNEFAVPEKQAVSTGAEMRDMTPTGKGIVHGAYNPTQTVTGQDKALLGGTPNPMIPEEMLGASTQVESLKPSEVSVPRNYDKDSNPDGE